MLLLLACAHPTADLPDFVSNEVVRSYEVADSGVGFDLSGDGVVDNAVGGLGPLLDPTVADSLAVAHHVVIAQVSALSDWDADSSVRFGVLTAEDPDGDGTNNGDDPVFSATGQVGEDGIALTTTPTSVEQGAYEATFAPPPLPIGSYDLVLATELHVQATSEGTKGLLGFGIALDELQVALAAEGFSDAALTMLADLADLDLDGDGVVDGVSMAFRFVASPCDVGP